MKTITVLICILFCVIITNAQNKVCFDYDVAGNRIHRYNNCSGKSAEIINDSSSIGPKVIAINNHLEAEFFPNPATTIINVVFKGKTHQNWLQ